MPTYLVLLTAAAVVIGFFILGMSITLMFRGHHIESEIGDNPNMKKLGIKCAVRESLDEEREIRGMDDCLPFSCGSSSECSSCETK